jgi:hypothetical protein
MLRDVRPESYKNRTLSARFSKATDPIGYIRSLLYLLYLHCDNWRKSLTPRFTRRGSLWSARPQLPCGVAPISHRATPRLPSRRGPTPATPSPPSHAVPSPCPCVPCPVPRRVEVLSMPAPPRGSTSAVTSRDPEWRDPEQASPAAPRAPFLS